MSQIDLGIPPDQIIPHSDTYDEDERKAWQEWRDSTEFLPISRFNEVLNRPNVLIPKESNVFMRCDTLEQFQILCSKLMYPEAFEAAGLIKTVWAIEHNDPDEVEFSRGMDTNEVFMHEADMFDLDDNQEYYTFDINPYWEEDGQLQVSPLSPHEEFQRRKPSSFILDVELSFPCLVIYNCFDVSDRCGSGEANMCAVYPIGPETKAGVVFSH